MNYIDVTELLEHGVAEPLLTEWRQAAEDAWNAAAPDLVGLGSRPHIVLGLQDPGRDARTVVASVGIGAIHGRVSAQTPTALRAVLEAHLRGRFAGPAA